MNLNELIKKYEEKCARTISNTPQEKIAFEILSDLRKLKESINGLNFETINAPNIVITQIMKNEIIGE